MLKPDDLFMLLLHFEPAVSKMFYMLKEFGEIQQRPRQTESESYGETEI